MPAACSRNSNGTPQRFLMVVDKDPKHRFALTMLLQRFEYRVLSAASVAEALETAAVAIPALVIADAELPGDRPHALLQHLRQTPSTQATPVIAQLSNGTHPSTYLMSGYSACLHKPVQAEDLYRTVQSLIEPTPRSNIRVQTKLPVSVDGKPLDCIEGECVSILSEYGMYVRTLRPSAAKSKIAVTIVLNGKSIPIAAEVLYCHKFGEGPFNEPGMGLRFAHIAAHDREFIKGFINAEVTRGITNGR